jgi:putative ABC transport system permease protein
MSWQDHDPKYAGVYHPAAPGDLQRLHVAIAVRGDPLTLIPALQLAAAAADPAIRVSDAGRLDDVNRGEITFYQFWYRLTLALSGVALVLSLAGIYAVMAFTVARKTREIGIRIALGASPSILVAGVLRRPLLQMTAGLVAGAGLAALLLLAAGGDISATGAAMLTVYGVFMLCVCSLACVIPVRRALGIEPTEVLKTDV